MEDIELLKKKLTKKISSSQLYTKSKKVGRELWTNGYSFTLDKEKDQWYIYFSLATSQYKGEEELLFLEKTISRIYLILKDEFSENLKLEGTKIYLQI